MIVEVDELVACCLSLVLVLAAGAGKEKGSLTGTIRDRNQRLECPDETLQDPRSTKPRELQRERVRTPHIGAELHFVKRRLKPLQPGHRGVPKSNTGLLPMHEDSLDPKPSPECP
jgi:hypothetical protein